MKQRRALSPGSTVSLYETPGGNTPCVFTVSKKINADASTVSYAADNGKAAGVLKEFYPDSPAYTRHRDGSLTEDPSDPALLETQRQRALEFKEAYLSLRDLRRREAEIASFIPYFEVYKNAEGSAVYIWTPDPPKHSFEEIVLKLARSSKRPARDRVVSIFTAVTALAEKVCLLHKRGYCLCDIKPSGFGFSGAEPSFDTLTLFDLGSTVRRGAAASFVTYSKGYSDPENKDSVTELSDIYSVGAILFSSLCADGNGLALYDGMYFYGIEQALASYPLLSSEGCADSYLVHCIAEVLKKSLCRRESRYGSAEELTEALRSVYKCALAPASGAPAGKDDADGLYLPLYMHLYSHPLFEAHRSGNRVLKVFVAGFGEYGSNFTDICLQAGQIPDIRLDVTVICRNIAEKHAYISKRPDLVRFFDIDGEPCSYVSPFTGDRPAHDPSLGSITFAVCPGAEAIRYLQDTAASCDGAYIFVSSECGTDGKKAALAACKAAKTAGVRCSVNYVREHPEANAPSGDLLNPVDPGDVKNSTDFAEVDRMALNTHFVWDPSIYANVEKTLRKFRTTYYYLSSVSSVMCLKHKLYGLNIDFSEGTDRAAETITKLKISSSVALTLAEHRRWLAEKICAGWVGPTGEDDIKKAVASGDNRIKSKKLHLCIVDAWNKLQPFSWKPNADTSSYDDLDRMSYEIHMKFTELAENTVMPKLDSDFTVLGTICGCDDRLYMAFEEWRSFIEAIYNDQKNAKLKTRMLENLRGNLFACAETTDAAKKVKVFVKRIEERYQFVLKSKEFTDYKRLDYLNIARLPFILTYSLHTALAVPFSDDASNNTAKFGNVTAATVVNPEEILYLYRAGKNAEGKIKAVLPGAIGFLQKKSVRSKIRFLMICKPGQEPDAVSLSEAFPSVVFDVIPCENERNIKGAVLGYLTARYKTCRFAAELNDTGFSQFLSGAGLYADLPYYVYDTSAPSPSFVTSGDCRWLSYTDRTVFLTASDLAMFNISVGASGGQPGFHREYADIYNLYASRKWAWKELCAAIVKDLSASETVISFTPPCQSDELKQFEYSVKTGQKPLFEDLLVKLANAGLCCPGGTVKYVSEEYARVNFDGYCKFSSEYGKLFASLKNAGRDESVTIDEYNGKLRVKRDIVSVSALLDQSNSKHFAAVTEILTELRDRFHLIEGGSLTEQSNEGLRISFRFLSGRAKKLLTSAGYVLEMYFYNKAVNSNKFDDVVNGFEIKWKGSKIENEFDCILTKGFRTWFVECKARADIQAEFYYKLSCLVKQFGINTGAVLLIESNDNVPSNAVQQLRGEELDVITITPYEIDKFFSTIK